MLAIITARGGSKRIPRKNIKKFCEKEILAYSIEAARRSQVFEEVMVSTDDVEIAEVAKKYGAAVPFLRSAGASDDFADTDTVLREVVQEYKKRGVEVEEFCCLYPTAPFVTGEVLCKAYEHFRETGADELVPVVRFSYPPQRGFVLDGVNLLYRWPEYKDKRSQDIEPIYHDAGQFYFMRSSALFRSSESEYKRVAFILDEMQVQDIDTVEDWELAELKFRMNRRI
jgi:pseudaminic acid CMP-transferase